MYNTHSQRKNYLVLIRNETLFGSLGLIWEGYNMKSRLFDAIELELGDNHDNQWLLLQSDSVISKIRLIGKQAKYWMYFR